MRGVEVLLIAGFLGLIGVGVWNSRRWLPDWWGPRIVRYGPSDPSGAPPGELAGKGMRGRQKRGFGSGNQSSARSDLASNGFPVSETEVDVPMPKFPLRTDFRPGATSAQIRAQYGEPTARTTEMRGGHMFEHYYYFNNDRTQLTMATLENGVIVSAASTSQ